MGRDIQISTISPEHRIRFRERLQENLAVLERLLEGGHFRFERRRIGVELEVALVGPDADPIGVNAELLELLEAAGLDFQSELGRFNVEFASQPLPLGEGMLDRLCDELTTTLDGARGCADTLGARLALIGVLPTITDFDLAEQSLSANARYRALNDAMLGELGEEPHLHIEGADLLDMHADRKSVV
jgi:gamma-glutamylcysteine synthetase